MESSASIIDLLRSLTSLNEIQMIAAKIISHVKLILPNQPHQIHMFIFGLGSLTAVHSAKIARFQLALFECVATYAEEYGQFIIKYAVDPLFTEYDRTVLSMLGYSILQAQDNCIVSSFLKLRASDRTICYLPHLPLHLVLSSLISAPSNSVFICPSLNKVLELELFLILALSYIICILNLNDCGKNLMNVIGLKRMLLQYSLS